MKSLLKIQPGSWKIALLIIPPIYALWQYALGRVLSEKFSTDERIIQIVGAIHVVNFTWAFVGVYFVQLLFPDLPIMTEGKEGMRIALAFFLVWFFLNGLLTRLSVKYDRQCDNDRHYGIVDMRDYIWRFFGFIYWPLFIWSYQKTANELVEKTKTTHNTSYVK